MALPSQVDLTNQIFTDWTVVYDPGADSAGRWLAGRLVTCKCRCGIRRQVRADRLVKGKSKSCGAKAWHPPPDPKEDV